MDAETVAEIFFPRFYRQHGLFAIIIFNQNKQFVNILWEKNMHNFRPQFTTPQIDKITERMNQTVETFLRIYIDFDQRNWVKLFL